MKMTDIAKLGKRQPFKVPEGYFENLTANVMAHIDETEQNSQKAKTVELKPKSRKYWGWISAVAACALIAILFATTTTTGTDHQQQIAQAIATEQYDDNYEEDMLEYAMVDNSDIYSYLSGGM